MTFYMIETKPIISHLEIGKNFNLDSLHGKYRNKAIFLTKIHTVLSGNCISSVNNESFENIVISDEYMIVNITYYAPAVIDLYP